MPAQLPWLGIARLSVLAGLVLLSLAVWVSISAPAASAPAVAGPAVGATGVPDEVSGSPENGSANGDGARAAAAVTVAPLPTIRAAGSAQLLFVGDVMLGRGITPIRRQQGNSYPLALVAQFIHTADLSFANLESPLTVLAYFRGGFNLHAEPAAAEALRLAGFDWVSVANNHSGDHGRTGMVDTLNALRAQNIAWAGGGETESLARRPAVKTINGLRVALLAYDGTESTLEAQGSQPGSQRLDVERAIGDIQAARAGGADIVIASIHWGVEYAPTASAAQRRIARQLAMAGADLVIGHHPHVVEPLEWIARPNGRTSIVAYSLGNFLFDQWFNDPVTEGVIARVMVDRTGVTALNLIPTRNTTGQVHAQSAAAAADEMRRLLPDGALPSTWERNAALDAEGRTWWRKPNP
jgi:poly-gamma-glutamate capsule biosynthesis protein CapA/YwtB (metallophosphatase superfamily)